MPPPSIFTAKQRHSCVTKSDQEEVKKAKGQGIVINPCQQFGGTMTGKSGAV